MADKKSKVTDAEEEMNIEDTQKSYVPTGLGIRHFQVSMMCICATIMYITRSSMGAAVLSMTDTGQNSTEIEIYEWSEEIRGVILSAFFWGYTIMQIPSGILSKRFGGKPLLLMTLIVNGALALATPTLAKLGGWIAVCAVRMGMGLTQACFMPSMHTLLGQWAPPQERTRLGIFAYAGIQIGTILTMPLCGVLAATAMGWKLIFYAMGSLSLVTAVGFWALTSSTPREHRFIKEAEADFIERSLDRGKVEEQYPTPWRQILTSRPLLAVATAHTGFSWTFIIFLVIIPTYLKNALGINVTDSASISALPFAAQWIISLCCSFTSDYLTNKKLLSLTNTRKLFNTIGSVGSMLGLIALSFISKENKGLAIAVLVFTVGMLGSSTCGFMLNHIDLSPRFGGLIFSITNFGANLIATLGPLSTGYIIGDAPTDIGRWRIVFSIAATFIVVSDFVFRLYGTSELQPWNEPHHHHNITNSYDQGLEKRLSVKSNNLDDKEEKVYSFRDVVINATRGKM